MEYNFREIEAKWQKRWAEEQTYRRVEDPSKKKYYVLDMFPYPSGAGLHVGHPLGYIASDIVARYRTLQGYNVLHPMGYDAFGLPAEQYAILTGQAPQITTEQNTARYRSQLDRIGFSFDWSREVKTCDPEYYKWTQWAFLRMFDSYYCLSKDCARPISELIERFEREGSRNADAACTEPLDFTAEEWKGYDAKKRSEVLMNYRIAYQGSTFVNWCPALGTVLANDEVKDGLSERGGFPVEQRKMTQWQLRVSAYAQRLLDSLDCLDWSDSLKEMQRNWIGRSQGTEVTFKVQTGDKITDVVIFTTRVDTIFGVTFMVLAPESDLSLQLTTPDRLPEVQEYIAQVKKKTERERIAETRTVTGVFSGSYGINPLTGEKVPVWISEYVLSGYGTGAIMAVPAHDSRDWAFAKKFGLPIVPIIEGCDVSEGSFDAKEGVMCNSSFLDGLQVKDAIVRAMEYVEEKGLGHRKVNYRLRDAIFSRQRYWGEPFPIYYKDGIPTPVDEADLPLQLPSITDYKPENGEPPLSHAKDWTYKGYPLETSTMPGFAGSSAYYLRYMDPRNDSALVSKEADGYWRSVDLYVGGTEHATGHLIYSRFWNKFLYDMGYVCEDEPFRKLVNQGMIQGRSSFVYRIKGTNRFVSYGLKDSYDTQALRADISMVDREDALDTEKFKAWREEYKDAEFILEDGRYICGSAVEKMSKSMYNVVNPDEVCHQYGADTLRLYEMFLGPLEQSKPWDTKGIDGVHRFLRKFWKLFYEGDRLIVEDGPAKKEDLRSLHKLIGKEISDIETFSFNTTISAFMIAVNELTESRCHNREILSSLVVMLCPFAPHICEELWHDLGNTTSVTVARFPEYREEYTVVDEVLYPVSFNGKTRFTVNVARSLSPAEVEAYVRSLDQTAKWVGEMAIAKVIVVPGRIVNVVLKK